MRGSFWPTDSLITQVYNFSTMPNLIYQPSRKFWDSPSNRKKAENLDKVPETSEIEVTAGSKVDTTEDETKDSKEPESSKNSSNQGDLLRSIVNWSGAA